MFLPGIAQPSSSFSRPSR
ncbi:hypothetical protein D047_2367A, partial [Vibrio parahaemolyticus VPTS-2010_2]